MYFVRDPSSAPDVLRRIVTEYNSGDIETIVRAVAPSVGFDSVLSKPPPLWHDAILWRDTFYTALTANPNLPLELFIYDLPLDQATVAGLLQNPICPLLLLEDPNFLEAFSESRQTDFIRLALHNRSIPAPLLHVLTCVRDPWLALEARTHRANAEGIPGEQSSNHAPPDLAWLDETVYRLLRSEPEWVRCIPYELALHGLLRPEVAKQLENPWQDAKFRASLSELVPDALVNQCLQEAQLLSGLDRKAYNKWWAKWCQILHQIRIPPWMPFRAIYVHPEIPHYVIARRVTDGHWRPEQILAIQHPDATPGLRTLCRRNAVRQALELGYHAHESPVFYLAVRDIPTRYIPQFFSRRDIPADSIPRFMNRVRFMNLKGRWKAWLRRWKVWLRRLPFLTRLGIAFRLDDRSPDQKELRTLLLDDPNRYVRAAARKEIVWPQ